MAIPESVIQQIQERVDIAEVISGFVTLKKSGRNFKALCPFHHEKTPSFLVSPEKQIFHCFGCGEGGNVFSFLMKVERVSFPEAAELIAERLGIEIPKFQEGTFPGELYQANALAVRYYSEMLIKSPMAATAREYLLKRGIQRSTIEKFQLGFAPNQWDGLIDFAKARGVSTEILSRAGLALPREGGGGYYDRFRNRLMFPIYDLRNRPIAFGGRVLDEGGSPKYLNSPETEIYQKGKQLYGFSLAKENIRTKDVALIVEGYFDLISLVQAGIDFVIATLGTALTLDQIRLLKRFTRRVVVLYDGDEAGQLGALRGLDLLLEEGCQVRLMDLPNGQDPDDFIRTSGISSFREKLQRAKDLLEYKLGLLLKKWDIHDPHQKTQVVQEMLVTIHRVESPILRGEYIKQLAEQIQVREQDLYGELNRFGRKEIREVGPKTKDKNYQIPLVEKLLLRLLYEYPDSVDQVKIQLNVEDFQTEIVRDFIRQFFQTTIQKDDVKTWIKNQMRDPEQAVWLSEILASEEEIVDSKKSLEDSIRWLKNQRLKKQLGILQQKIGTAGGNPDATLKDLLVEYQGVLNLQQQLSR